MKTLLLIALLALAAAAPAAAETPDQCAERLDLDIRVASIAAATAWYEQVMRECAPDQPGAEGTLRLTLRAQATLPVTGCTVYYHEARASENNIIIVPRLFHGSIKLHWRHGIAGDWTTVTASEIQIVTGGGVSDQFTPFMDPLIKGAGNHQFELRTRAGADKFEIFETWGALYLADIYC